jgi:hypothetical protein
MGWVCTCKKIVLQLKRYTTHGMALCVVWAIHLDTGTCVDRGEDPQYHDHPHYDGILQMPANTVKNNDVKKLMATRASDPLNHQGMSLTL